MPLGEALIHAERCRSEGRLAEAESLCRRVLEAEPNLPEAEHLLGVIAHQNGKLGEAIEHVQRAANLAPQIALFHANLGEMFRLAGRPRLAAEEARRALAIEPRMAAALSDLGVALYELKEYEEAAAAHRKAMAASRISPRRSAISAMRCMPCGASTRRPKPITGPSRSTPMIPTAWPISAPRFQRKL